MLLAHSDFAKMENLENSEPVYCKLNPLQLQVRKELFQTLIELVKDKTEVENGYIFKSRGSDEIVDRIITIIKMERRCCSFLTFDLTIKKETDLTFLKITGPKGTKDFLLHKLGLKFKKYDNREKTTLGKSVYRKENDRGKLVSKQS